MLNSKTIALLAGLVLLAIGGLVAVSWLTAPKIVGNDELQAREHENLPEEIPPEVLARMNKVILSAPEMT